MTDPAAAYNAAYYQYYRGGSYERSEYWLNFFGAIADRIVSDFEPASVLDAGCAMGFLVEALRDRGVAAEGLDVSPYAIERVRDDIKPYCRVGSLTEPIPGRYDLVVCIEVLEHLEPSDARLAVANLCACADDILLSSTPDEFHDATHVNVQEPSYWASLFMEQGFWHDVDFDASFLTLWAMRFRRAHDPVKRLVANYERKLWRLTREVKAARDDVDEEHSALERAGQLEDQVRGLVSRNDTLNLATSELERALAEGHAERESLTNELFSARREMDVLRQELDSWRDHWARVEDTAAWRAVMALRRVRHQALPEGSGREEMWLKALARAGIRGAGPELRTVAGSDANDDVAYVGGIHREPYAEWIARTEPGPEGLRRQSEQAGSLAYRPLISLVVPVFNPRTADLTAMVDSVKSQTYDNWELCMADASDDATFVAGLAEETGDPRVRIVRLPGNRGISGNTNAGIEAARGEFVAFLDQDDTLAPFALFEVVTALNERPDLDVVYSDHDILDAAGQRIEPLFKPNWSPETMLSANYLTHLTVVRGALVAEVGGFDPSTDGAQDWDLFLRIVERTGKIHHIPKVLYHWRDAPGSTARDIRAKSEAPERQVAAIQGHLSRLGLRDPRAWFDVSGYIRVSWKATPRLVSIIIPTRGADPLLLRCVSSILQTTTHTNYEIIIVNNGDRVPDEDEDYRALRGEPRVRILHWDRPFNYAAVNNFAAGQARGEILVFLNNDTEIRDANWLDELSMWAERPEIGAVGAKLLWPDGRIQHGGVVVGLGGFAGHLFAGAGERGASIFGQTEWYRDVTAVTGACLAIRREIFEQVGGFGEEFTLCGNDVDLGMKLWEAGLRVVYDPFARLTHHESATHRGSIPAGDYVVSATRYEPLLRDGDPFFHPALSSWSSLPRLSEAGERPPLDFVREFVAKLEDRGVETPAL